MTDALLADPRQLAALLAVVDTGTFSAAADELGYTQSGVSQQVAALYGLDVEPTVLYRVLRGLDKEGHASSRWVQSSSGPRRRLYTITKDGRNALDALVAPIEATRKDHDAFLRAYESRAASI